ncbi:MAG TPA: hypothetical protein VLT86_11480 [Vicinamibacterales bacterium]|nr:hypothetical protein [Vicinamibacterales bacterium]
MKIHRLLSQPRVLALPALAVLLSVALSTTTTSQVIRSFGDGHDDRDERANDAYAIGLWGDLPYSTIQETVGLPNLFDDMNRQRLAFTVHDGDLKTGNGAPVCSDDLYVRATGWFNSLEAPAAFTPGDNDWTDCDRPNNGSFRSLERLSHERQVFFSTPRTLGQHTLLQTVQTTPTCWGERNDASHTRFLEPCVENRRWTYGRVTYATLNIQGTCNNLCGDGADPQEFGRRNTAVIAWMRETFAEAKARGSAAVMLISQADPGFDLTDATRTLIRDPKTLVQDPSITDPDGYFEFLSDLRDEVIAFRRPVAYVHGDSHYFRVDRPFLNAAGVRLENFTRVETFGDNASNTTLTNDVQWLKVLVDPRSREVFAYQAQIVPANRVAVPAPR